MGDEFAGSVKVILGGGEVEGGLACIIFGGALVSIGPL